MEWKSNRRVLIVAGPKSLSKDSLAPHEALFAKNLETSLKLIAEARPGLVVYFAKNRDDALEDHVLTWLIEGFHGKFLLFDSFNRVRDFSILVQSQVVDDYYCGPVSLSRFVSIVRNRLAHDGSFATPRAMTTFDLFRNLFERGLNAIFFFDQDLNRCVAANLRAEQITGKSLAELRRSNLRELCTEDGYDATLRIIRRAGHSYYDSRGIMSLKDARNQPLKVSFSCGVFKFGRRNFIKVEVQGLAANLVTAPALQEESWTQKLPQSILSTHA